MPAKKQPPKASSGGHTTTAHSGYRMTKVKHVQYHKDGSVWAKGFLVGDKMEGYWEWFRKDGTIMRAGSFKNNKQVGKWTTYDKTGKVVKVTEMK